MTTFTCTRPSTLAGAMEDARGLFPYIASTTLMTVAKNEDLMTRLALVNGKDWRAYKPLHLEAEKRHGKREASEGTNIHSVVQALHEGYDVSRVPDPARSDGLAVWQHIQDRGWQVAASEAFVANLHDLPEPVAGTADLILYDPKADVHFVADTKSTGNPSEGKYSAIKWAIQTACYALGSPWQGEGDPVRDQWGRPVLDSADVGEWPFAVSQDWALILEVHRGRAVVREHWIDLAAGRRYAAAACMLRTLKRQGPETIYLEAPL